MAQRQESSSGKFVVERFVTGSAEVQLAHIVEQCEGIASHSGRGRIDYLGSAFIPEDAMCLCFFEADSRAALEEANRRAGLEFERVAEVLLGPPAATS